MTNVKCVEDVKINHRVECDGTKGTVKWIGEIPETKGLWFGVDWDEGVRGKHNGSHNGINYFITKTLTSGSFVRPTKLNLGMSLEDGIRGRYQDDTTIEDEVTTQLKRSTKARFVEVVGMEKIGKRQSQLDALETVVLNGWLVYGNKNCGLSSLLPRVKYLDVSYSLLSSWVDVASITRQLKSLRHLIVSGNSLVICYEPDDLVDSTKHVTHLVMSSMIGYTWDDLMLCSKYFPNVINLQLAYNGLKTLEVIPPGLFECLQEIDVGMNPISNWKDICVLGRLPKLSHLNICDCKVPLIEFPETPIFEKTSLFPKLRSLSMANNPLNYWDSISELEKLSSLEEITLSHDSVEGVGNYFMEFTFARLINLRIFNRTRVTPRDKRDYQIYYLRVFAEDYFNNGGKDNISESNLTPEFIQKHPTYLTIAKVHGVPVDERNHVVQKSQKLRNLQIEITIKAPESEKHEDFVKTFLPSTKISKMKMMIKRAMKLPGPVQIKLAYTPKESSYEIDMNNDSLDIHFYSMSSGDTLFVRW